jgi:hypothetical protein
MEALSDNIHFIKLIIQLDLQSQEKSIRSKRQPA